MPLRIGIVACSAEGAALCYRTLCAEAASFGGRPYDHPEILLHGHSLGAYVECLQADDLDGVGELMLSSARHLTEAGAEFLICPDNTIHRALPRIENRSPLPWLHIADEVARHAAQNGLRRIAVMGTRWLTESDVYPAALSARGLQCVLPDPDTRELIGRIIMDELVRGQQRSLSIDRLCKIAAQFRLDGCDAIALACTELPLVLDDTNCGMPTLDSTRLLARAALRRAYR
ncbi:aspartate racemase [Bordetella genomosp. 1]|uniref:Aspartate racemase n=1 Tax=Bordetella genomosp. 1 TaxID=1395607 RepID=A0A261S6V7_9BORD|nr:amino acid racemase [Bordetella genomosp. 1]MDQ8030975.1 amino acid racemase [Bordetella sp.]OZI33114.1 aspartate racemase [Bordetella genomosp. 1]OZI57220.1 aspartate racemase [Bordetella genomosp. 1]